MARYRTRLPQLGDALFVTDGGMETTFVFHDGHDLPSFAAFDLLKTEAGEAHIRRYYERYLALARQHRLGFILETATWRANPDWGRKIGYSEDALAEVNRRAVALVRELRDRNDTPRTPVVISGNIGPRGDGYSPERLMGADEAEAYHAWQIGIFRDTEADFVSAFTLNYVEEAIGVTRAATAAGMPVVISFTVETDGRLPTGQPLGEAIDEVDAATGSAPVYYMLNCAHPTHLATTLAGGEAWIGRLRGLRANASRRSHAELDAAPDLDAGDPVELGQQYRAIRRRLGNLNVLGGCCGTDHRHIEQILLACTAVAA